MGNAKKNDVSVSAVPRASTWGKIFDFNDVGLTENNYQAYTYDFTFSNNTGDEVSSFKFKLTFNRDVYLSSGWNGVVEIHQYVGFVEHIMNEIEKNKGLQFAPRIADIMLELLRTDRLTQDAD